jgi:hypothetical protein
MRPVRPQRRTPPPGVIRSTRNKKYRPSALVKAMERASYRLVIAAQNGSWRFLFQRLESIVACVSGASVAPTTGSRPYRITPATYFCASST